jgi:hypothetical protein
MQSACLLVPVCDTSDVVSIPVNEVGQAKMRGGKQFRHADSEPPCRLVPAQVPDDPEELLELLAAEAAPLSTWVDSAKAYLAAGKEDAFTHICLEGVTVSNTINLQAYLNSTHAHVHTHAHIHKHTRTHILTYTHIHTRAIVFLY